MEFHIARSVRDRYGVSDVLFNYAGNVVFADVGASRELAKRVNDVRGAHMAPELAVHAASLFAMGLIDELSHALIAEYREKVDPDVVTDALSWLAGKMGAQGVGELLTSFTAQFPNAGIYRGEQTVAEWMAASEEGRSNREAALEELLLLWLANQNPAFRPFKEFFDDSELKRTTVYKELPAQAEAYFETRPAVSPEVGTLLDALRAPMLASPDSLTGQLAYIREMWVERLGDGLRQVLLAVDVLKEEDIAIWMQFHPPSAEALERKRRDEQRAGWGSDGFSEGFVGDEFIGYAEGARAGLAHGQQGEPEQPVVHEYEAFSPDQAWMPTVVLIAKSTYVWLEQLSKKYGRHIQRLDQIPDEEFGVLADRGLNGLWLIGLWERSVASQTIKRLRGQADAVASAYSVADYRIAEDLGGEAAYDVLRHRAAAKGIRLASDMVPNHMGIDSTWVMEHPEWFVSRPTSPFPVYSFEGPDLSDDSRVEIKIEDHYFDQTDAAVVFRRRERRTGETSFVYHGNDGTTFAWNDTAQLDYSKAEVREQVMQTILAVARLFPIIRFDAAMTLAKKHVQRLWFPIPGVGGSIPSRAESAMSNAEFDALMPNEFWREVVDRVTVEVPGTLLLAEAFWLLEGYFVRTLGMHRVYNSAFMNMLRDEENAKYRSYLKKTIEFDPDILKRYVNFMSNPDERTAVDQFGSGDRYFGVCTLLATLPGLPMFGHGQIEAFTEKYGMEYKRARFEEWPNEDLVARHQREIAPLLKNRKLYAESANFVLYDFRGEDGSVDENVFAYSNRLGEERVIVVFNNRYGDTRGTIHISAESMDKLTGSLRTRTIVEALNLSIAPGSIVAYTDRVSGLAALQSAGDLDQRGLSLDLRAYQYLVLQDWRELHDTDEEPWGKLCDALAGASVVNLEREFSEMRLRPLRTALSELINPWCVQQIIDAAHSVAVQNEEQPEEQQSLHHQPEVEAASSTHSLSRDRMQPVLLRAMGLLDAARSLMAPDANSSPGLPGLERNLLAALRLPVAADAEWAETVPRRVLPLLAPESGWPSVWVQVLAWLVFRELGEGGATAEAFDELRLRALFAQAVLELGLEGEDAWSAAARVRVLLCHRCAPARPVEELVAKDVFWVDADVRWLIGVSYFEGKTYFNKEQFDELLLWLSLPELIESASTAAASTEWHAGLRRLTTAASEAGYEVSRLQAGLRSSRTSHEGVMTSAGPVSLDLPTPSASEERLVEAAVPEPSAEEESLVREPTEEPTESGAPAKKVEPESVQEGVETSR